nr:site-specific tyrosine recombinase/integron integrase [Methanobrevibacter sp.]
MNIYLIKKFVLNSNITQTLNKNLEQLSQNLFRKWFIDFDLEKDFNISETFKESSLGEIPESWEIKTIGNLSEVKGRIGWRGYTTNDLVDEGPWVVGGKEITSGFIDFNSAKHLTREKYEESPEIMLKDKDLIIAKTGTIGPIAMYYDIYGEATLNPNVGLIRSKNIAPALLLSFFKTPRAQYYLNEFTTSSVQPAINQTTIKQLEVALPSDIQLLNKIGDKFEEINLLQFNLNEEIKKLQKLRDTLLPKLMSGEIDVSQINCDMHQYHYLNYINMFTLTHSINLIKVLNMKTKIISKIQNQMKPYLNQGQYIKLTNSLLNSLQDIDVIDKNNELNEVDNFKLLNLFLSAKQVEGCSEKTIKYYKSTIEKMLMKIRKQVYNINTDDLRKYLFEHKNHKKSSKTTIDNIRRIFSSFFSWLEDEDYIIKNPVRRIHRVKTGRVVKEVLTDENLEILRDNCEEIRDLAIVELLTSTGIRVGELVRLNIEDINFYERECIVFGKGESERVVYFDARTKIHLLEYLETRIDENPALFVSLNNPYERLGISGVETRLRELGRKCNINKVHPHKFRRTMATNAIDKGMPIEQVQKLLGHVQIDTTMQYAMVNQSNVKLAHRKFIG